MKLTILLLAVAIGSIGTAAAQTAPQTTPSNPNSTSAPNTTPSGMSPGTNNPNGPVSAGEAFTKGAPANTNLGDKGARDSKRAMRKGDKMKMSDGKMKTKM